jgi:hypothetical protein
MAAGVVKGEGFAVDARIAAADCRTRDHPGPEGRTGQRHRRDGLGHADGRAHPAAA